MSQNPTYEELWHRVQGLEKRNVVVEKAYKAIADSEELYRTTIENISDTVIIADDQGVFTYVCPNTYFIFDMSQDDVYKLGTIHKLVNGTLCDIHELKTKTEIANIERTIIDKSGNERFLLINAKSVNIQGGTVLYVMRDITERKRAEEALQQLNETLEQQVAERTAKLENRTKQLQQLALELSDAEDRERRNIATILHDDFQQRLALVKMELVMIRQKCADGKAGQKLGNLEQLIGACIEKSRELSFEINPPALHCNGLLAALDVLAQDMKDKHNLYVRVDTQPDAEPDSITLASILYRSARELLINVVKHAGVDSAVMDVRCNNGMIFIRVEDFGNGFDYDTVRSSHGRGAGFGLYSIEDRITFLGGSMKIKTAPGKGCCVVLTVPKDISQKTAKPAPSPEDS